MTTIKKPIRKLINLIFGEHNFNDGHIYSLYLMIFKSKSFNTKKPEHYFYKNLFNNKNDLLIFDIGANHGSKSMIFKDFARSVIAVDPNPDLCYVLKKRFLKYQNKITVVQKGVGSEKSTMPFYIFDDKDAYNTFSKKWVDSLNKDDNYNRPKKTIKLIIDVPVVTLDCLISEYGNPDYIKIDVEGFELDVFSGLNQSVNLISFECNLPEFEEETIECIDLIKRKQSKPLFNFCISEPPEFFVLDEWVAPEKMKEIVTSRKYQFMEIYCKSNN